MSETPRTDRYYGCWATWEPMGVSIFDHAQMLERELNAANARIHQLESRISTIADEACGIDVRTADDALTAIEKKLFDQRKRIIDEIERNG